MENKQPKQTLSIRILQTSDKKIKSKKPSPFGLCNKILKTRQCLEFLPSKIVVSGLQSDTRDDGVGSAASVGEIPVSTTKSTSVGENVFLAKRSPEKSNIGDVIFLEKFMLEQETTSTILGYSL